MNATPGIDPCVLWLWLFDPRDSMRARWRRADAQRASCSPSAPRPETVFPATATVTGGIVNIRTGPGHGFAVVGQVAGGDQLRVLGRSASRDWLHIEHPTTAGRTVWIHAALTDVDGVPI